MGAGSSRDPLLNRVNVKSRIDEELRAAGPLRYIGSEREKIIDRVLEMARENPNVRSNAAKGANERAEILSRPDVKRAIAKAWRERKGDYAPPRGKEYNELVESFIELARQVGNLRSDDELNANIMKSKAAKNAEERATLLSRKNVKRRIAQALDVAGPLASVGSEREKIIESVLELARKNPNIRYKADKNADKIAEERATILSRDNVRDELARRYALAGWEGTVGSKHKEIEESVIRNFMNGKILPVKAKTLGEHLATSTLESNSTGNTDTDALRAAAAFVATKMPEGLNETEQRKWISTELENNLSSGYFSLVNALNKNTRKALQKYKSGILKGATKNARKSAANRGVRALRTPANVAAPAIPRSLSSVSEGDDNAELRAAEEEERRILKELERAERLKAAAGIPLPGGKNDNLANNDNALGSLARIREAAASARASLDNSMSLEDKLIAAEREYQEALKARNTDRLNALQDAVIEARANLESLGLPLPTGGKATRRKRRSGSKRK